MQLLPVKSPEGVTFTQVDDVDYLWAQQYNWHKSGKYVARSQRRGPENKPYRMYLHREVMGLKHGHPGSVIDGDPFNNLRSNLRVATYAENAHNRRDRTGGTSDYRGVSWYASRGQWRVAIMVNGERTLVGYFDDEHEAGLAAQAFYAEHMPLYSGHRQDEAQPARPGAENSDPSSVPLHLGDTPHGDADACHG